MKTINLGKNLAVLIAMLVIISVNAQAWDRPWNNVDVCNWDKALPLGSDDPGYCIGQGVNLNWNTYWPTGTNDNPSDTSDTCTFNGMVGKTYDLYVSIDNDIIKCTLNGVVVFDYTKHEYCPPENPKDGFHIALHPEVGSNTLICEVRDRGYLSHFDAIVVGTSGKEGEGNCDPKIRECKDACSNGKDDDGDGLTDAQDMDCLSANNLDACHDGIDNDGDGLIDMADPSCNALPEPTLAIAAIAALAPALGYGLVRRRNNKN